MKKLFFIITMTLLTLNVSFAQSDSTKYVTNSNIEKLVDKYTTNIAAGIAALATQLKQPAEFVYGVMVKQQYVKAATHLFYILGFFISLVLAMHFANNIDNWDKSIVKPGKTKASPGFLIAFGILSLVFLVVTLDSGSYLIVIQGFLNPDFGAMQDIVDIGAKIINK